MLSFLIAYFLLIGCTLISRSNYIRIEIWFKENAHSSLKVYFLNFWYRLLSINVKLIVLLAVPYCHIIALGGMASLRLPLFTTFNRHSAWHLVATWVPLYYK